MSQLATFTQYRCHRAKTRRRCGDHLEIKQPAAEAIACRATEIGVRSQFLHINIDQDISSIYKISKALRIQLVDLMRYEEEIQTEKGRELQEFLTYLSTKKLEEIRLAKRITKAVMEELGG